MKGLILTVLVTIACASSLYVQAGTAKIEENIANSFAKYGKCFEDRRGLMSFLAGLKFQKSGKKMVDAFVGFEEAVSREIQAIHEIPHADMILNELKTILTTKMITDKRFVDPESLVNFPCLLETTLDLFKTDESFQNLINFFRQPEQVEALKHLESSTEAQTLGQLLRQAGVGVESIAKIFNDVFSPVQLTHLTPVQQFASSSYKAFNCSTCPGCTACLPCCVLKDNM